jgi:outer membrane receptor protein involved in Fe transport
LNFKQEKLGVSLGTFGNMFNDPVNIDFNERQVFGPNSSNLRQDGTATYNSRNMGGNITLSYEPDSLNLISVQLSANTGKGETDRELSSLFRSPGTILEAYNMLYTSSGSWKGSDASLNYQLGFKKSKQQLLTLSYRHTRFNDNRNLEIILSDRVNYTLPDFRQFNEGGPSEQTIQLDYVQPVKKATMETGIKGIFRDNYSDFEYRSKNLSGAYEFNPALSNQYDNSQSVMGFYNSWQVNLKNWGFKAGLRFEQTKIHADFISSGTVNKQDYTNLLPSVSVSRKINTELSLGIAYSQRIQRPSIWDLNPFVNRENPNVERTGNPGLKPVLANNFQFTMTRSGKTTLSTIFSHSYTNNALQFYLLYDTQTQINRLMPFNTGTNKSTGLNINISHPVTSKWNASLNTNLNYVKVTGFVENTPAKNEGITGNFMLSSGYRFDKGWRVNGNINYALTPFILLQGEGRTIVFSSLSINKDLLKEKLSLSAQLSNPFTKYMYFPNNLRTGNYEFVKSHRSWFRVFGYSLNYKFGKLKGTIAKNKRGINNDDVEGGAKP